MTSVGVELGHFVVLECVVDGLVVLGTVDDAGLAVLDRVVAAGYVPAKPDAKYGRPSTPVIVTTATVQQ